jgi:hypothetical protein
MPCLDGRFSGLPRRKAARPPSETDKASLRREAHELRRADVSRDGVAALEGLAIGELYEALGSANTPDDIEAQVLQLSENRSDPSSLRQHFDSAEVVSNGSVTPPASTRRSAIAPLLAAVRLCGARRTPTYEAKAPRNRQVSWHGSRCHWLTASPDMASRVPIRLNMRFFAAAPRSRPAHRVSPRRVHLATRLHVLERFVSGRDRRTHAKGEEEDGDNQCEASRASGAWGTSRVTPACVSTSASGTARVEPRCSHLSCSTAINPPRSTGEGGAMFKSNCRCRSDFARRPAQGPELAYP